jgi:carboxymethylenebutenolidase
VIQEWWGHRTVTAPIEGQHGEQDAFYPIEQARAQEQQIRKESRGTVEFFNHPAGHAFHNEKDLLGTYDKEYADLAWERAVTFLRATVQ